MRIEMCEKHLLQKYIHIIMLEATATIASLALHIQMETLIKLLQMIASSPMQLNQYSSPITD